MEFPNSSHDNLILEGMIAEKISGGHVPSVSCIPVITHARASPFLA
jgi:hypothetical protein